MHSTEARPKACANTRRENAPSWAHPHLHAVRTMKNWSYFRRTVCSVDATLSMRSWVERNRFRQFTDLCLSFCLTAFDIVKYNSPKERHKLYQIPSLECKLIALDRFHGCFWPCRFGLGHRLFFMSHSRFLSSDVGLR